jgi:hypothetical protein
MNTETVRVLIGCGFFAMLLVLRLEANRFGAAEYDEPGAKRGGPWTRISWYLIGLALLAALYVVHPAPHDVLSLLAGHRTDVIFYGAIVALLGLAQAAAFARFHYGSFRLPAPSDYPGAGLNSIATAVIDEATFRGALLGTFMALGLPDGWAILVATILYILVTRMAAPGHHWYMLLLAAFVGLACGWATIASGGIGAAIIGHAVTSFGVFVFTGHAGQVPVTGREPEELELLKGPPEGWQDVRTLATAAPDAAAPAFAEPIGPSGFSSRAQGRSAPAWPSALLVRMRDRGVALAGRSTRPSR